MKILKLNRYPSFEPRTREPRTAARQAETAFFFAAVFFFTPAFFTPAVFAFGFAPRARFGAASALPSMAPPPPAGAAVTGFGRSDTRTVRCAVRFTTRKARPIGAGRMRFCEGPWFA